MLEDLVNVIDCMQQSDSTKIRQAEEYVQNVSQHLARKFITL